ncbi:MAG: DUF4115 domain-containing protein [Gammaproteobacteria bacterium]|nr:MAG: DUF4115 domain-containing protein [Gammaproteobacteria bacterium]QMU62638.1 MAG: DUF4115 domain-containing protein [Gammaproteobacteria bacterium]
MQERNNNSETQITAKKSVSIGALLSNARTAMALSQADVAEQLNLPKHIIQAIEVDDYESLPESTYIRGYLRNYARVVGVNDEGLVKLYFDQHHFEPVAEVNRKSKQSYDPAILWSSAAVFSILVGLVITWWFDANQIPEQGAELVNNKIEIHRDNAEGSLLDKSLAGNDQVSEVKVPKERFVTEAKSKSSFSISEAGQRVTGSDEAVTADQQQAMEEASRNPTLVTSIDGTPVLTVTYVEKSWTEIRDADSNTLIQGLIEPGVVRNLSGKPPFEIFLGNSPGVIIEVNGFYFDHSQYSRSNRTARFQVSNGSLN